MDKLRQEVLLAAIGHMQEEHKPIYLQADRRFNTVNAAPDRRN